MLCERHRKERRQDRLPEAYSLGGGESLWTS